LLEQPQTAVGTGGVIDRCPEAAAVGIELLQRRLRQALQRHAVRAELLGARALAGVLEQIETFAANLIEHQHQFDALAEIIQQLAQQLDRIEAICPSRANRPARY